MNTTTIVIIGIFLVLILRIIFKRKGKSLKGTREELRILKKQEDDIKNLKTPVSFMGSFTDDDSSQFTLIVADGNGRTHKFQIGFNSFLLNKPKKFGHLLKLATKSKKWFGQRELVDCGTILIK